MAFSLLSLSTSAAHAQLTDELQPSEEDIDFYHAHPDLAPLSTCYGAGIINVRNLWRESAGHSEDERALYFVMAANGGYLLAINDIFEDCRDWYLANHAPVDIEPEVALRFMKPVLNTAMISLHRDFYVSCLSKRNVREWKEVYQYCKQRFEVELDVLQEIEKGRTE